MEKKQEGIESVAEELEKNLQLSKEGDTNQNEVEKNEIETKNQKKEIDEETRIKREIALLKAFGAIEERIEENQAKKLEKCLIF